MKVLMLPHLKHFRSEESGIKRVVEAYFRYLPRFDIELVDPLSQNFDLVVGHAGMGGGKVDVAMVHGLYWTADYSAATWEWQANANVIDSVRMAVAVTVPSNWVAETFKRDMRLSPWVIGHGIEWREWQHKRPNRDYVLWNKNRTGDVCSPEPMGQLARQFPSQLFLTTFAPSDPTPNIKATGLVSHPEMKVMIQEAAVYLSTTKETFGIGILEALASGIPVLGYGEGGILDIVEHGVHGYLAVPGNADDLAEGLRYCLKYRTILGNNGRERAREFTWERVAEQVAAVYRRAVQPVAPTVGVVIPVYRKSLAELRRAVESVLAQTDQRLTQVVVVDDGTPEENGYANYVNSVEREGCQIRYIRQENKGVAYARNRGIAELNTKFACPLDADDAIEPTFLQVCVNALEADRSLGVAYTRLRWVKGDGSTGVSDWPGEWNYDEFLKKRAQVPTCAVFRKQAWACLGGYRARYCTDLGAGAEDAEFYLRMGAYGWKGKLAADVPLFVYSWGTGLVSGNRQYKEPPWLDWHPWVRDGLHPFASHATPHKHAHPVRQYDRPLVSVIIPVGPRHVDMLVDALDSLEAQTERSWQAIVVDDSGQDLAHSWLATAYPYVHWLTVPTGSGAGVARNRGTEPARGNFLLFLDADDWLLPTALESMLEAWQHTPAAIYTDYLGIATVADTNKLALNLQNRIIERNERTQETTIRYDTLDYDCERAQRQPENRPYLWCNVTTLIPRAWHDQLGGFDETMDSWEDVDYWYRLAMQGRCFVRIPQPLLVYRFSTGSRRESGLHSWDNLIKYLREKYKGVKKVACKSCGQQRYATVRQPVAMGVAAQKGIANVMERDEDFVWVYVNDGNRGQHPIIGRVTKRHYGYHATGDKILMHRGDREVQAHIFVLAEKSETIKESPPLVQTTRPPVAKATATAQAKAEDGIATVPMERPFDLQILSGMSYPISQELESRGVFSAEKIVEIGEERLQQIRGVGPSRAKSIVESAQAYLNRRPMSNDQPD